MMTAILLVCLVFLTLCAFGQLGLVAYVRGFETHRARRH
jgi:hypothetical protein